MKKQRVKLGFPYELLARHFLGDPTLEIDHAEADNDAQKIYFYIKTPDNPDTTTRKAHEISYSPIWLLEEIHKDIKLLTSPDKPQENKKLIGKYKELFLSIKEAKKNMGFK